MESDIIYMLRFIIDNICLAFGGYAYQESIGIPVGMLCAPLLVDLFVYSYETIHGVTYIYIDDVI